jgi:hypothetical protein
MKEDGRRRLGWLRVLGAVALTAVGAIWATETSAEEMPRVRSGSPFIRGVISDAVAWSPTFRKIVTAIGATDGIVYVEQGVCGHGVRACLNFTVTRAAGFRFLRILVDLRSTSTAKGRLDLIGTIGHELWHALEVLADRTLTTHTAIFHFYSREAPTSKDSFETAGAISAGLQVRHEAAGGATRVTQQASRDQCAGLQGMTSTDGLWTWSCS